jgi:hypothetical protein
VVHGTSIENRRHPRGKLGSKHCLVFSQQKEPQAVSTASGMICERLSDDKRIAVEDESRALTESVFRWASSMNKSAVFGRISVRKA